MYNKSILRSLILDGGVSITDPARLRDLLAEQAQKSTSIQHTGTIGGGISAVLGLAMMSINPGALIATMAGAYALYLGQRNKPTTAEEKEFGFLSRHGRIINLIGDFAKAGNATEDEVLGAYETLIRSYMPMTDQIAVDGKAIAAGEMMAQLPKVIAAQRDSLKPSDGHALPVKQGRKSIFAPSRLHEYGQSQPNPAFQPAAPNIESTQVAPSPVALLNRAFAKEAAIGLPTELAAVTVNKPYSTFVIGMSGAGKDITLYNIIAALKTQYPTAYFLGIDGKAHPNELPLWPDAIYDRKLHISMLDRPQDYHPTMLARLKEACEFPGKVFVAFSELNGIAATYAANGMKNEWGEITHYLRYLALQGNASGKFFLSTAQGITLEELGISTATRANIQFLMLGNATQFGFVASVTANTTVFDRKLINDQNAFIAACSRSNALSHLPNFDIDKGVAYFHTALNRWEPMPRLANPGHDRGLPLPAETTVKRSVVDAVPWITVPTTSHDEVDQAAGIEVEELIDTALEMLYTHPGRQFSLTKLFENKSQRSRLANTLIEVLKDAEGIEYKPKKNGAVVSHYFVAKQEVN
jgi:hypothetical protein